MGSLEAVALSRLSGRKAFICTGCAISLHLHMNGLMKQSSGPCTASISEFEVLPWSLIQV